MSDFFNKLFVNHGVSGVTGVTDTKNLSATACLGKHIICSTSHIASVSGVTTNESYKSITIQNDRESITPVTPATPDLSMLNNDERYNFEERAAIMEYDGGLSREEAERQAYNNVIEMRRYKDGEK